MFSLGVNMYEGTGVIRRTHGVLPGMRRRVKLTIIVYSWVVYSMMENSVYINFIKIS